MIKKFYLKEKSALMIDIGGGSTELILGDQNENVHLDSMKLGAIRITANFFSSIRVAEALDRSHQGVIRTAEFTMQENGKIFLDIYSDADCQLELWRLNNHNKLFKKVFKQKFVVRVFYNNKQLIPQIESTLDN